MILPSSEPVSYTHLDVYKRQVYNFVTKRGHCKGVDSKLSWTQVETGSAITWK